MLSDEQKRMADKRRLIHRMEHALEKGKGVRLSADEIGLLFAAPEKPDQLDEQSVEPPPDEGSFEVQIRWLIRADMPEVLAIEAACFEYPWNEGDFLCCLRQRTCIGMVALYNDKVLGFIVYELFKGRLSILNLAVHPRYQGRGIGRAMVARLKDKLSQQRRTQITAGVRESNLPAQLFLKRQGFACTRQLRGHYDDTGEDCYVMDYKIPRSAKAKDQR